MPPSSEIEWSKKDILIPYFKKQIRDLSEIINRIEANDTLEEAAILEFFYQKKKDEKKIIKSIFNHV